MSATSFAVARHRAAQKRARHAVRAGAISAAEARNEAAVRSERDKLDETKSEIAELRRRIGRTPKGGRADDAEAVAFRGVRLRLARKLGAINARHLDERVALAFVLDALGFSAEACAAVGAALAMGEPHEPGPNVFFEGDFGAEVSLARLLGALNFSEPVRATALAILAAREAA